jgi:hypothetical protein
MAWMFGAWVLVAALALGSAGCDDDDDSPSQPSCSPVDLQPQKQTLVLGGTAAVTAFGGDRTFYEFRVDPDVPGLESKSKSDPASSVDDMFFWRPTEPNPGLPSDVYATITVTSCLGSDAPVSDVALVYLLNE